jgi:tetratricopeptide (TPR) repeat protein
METYEKLYSAALAATESGDFQNALIQWLAALAWLGQESAEPNPDKADVQLHIATCQNHLGHYEPAMELCESVSDYYGATFSDVSDEAQRALTLLVEIATSAEEFDYAREISEAAIEAMEAEPDECEPSTLVALARKRALLAIKMGQPDDAEDAWDLALERLGCILELDGMPELFYREVLFHQARCHEFRAENRFLGGASQIAEIDLKDAFDIYQEAGLPGDDVERVRAKLIEALES